MGNKGKNGETGDVTRRCEDCRRARLREKHVQELTEYIRRIGRLESRERG